MSSKTVLGGLLLVMIGMGAVSGDTSPATSVRFTPLTRRHKPNKLVGRREDGTWASTNWSGYSVTGAQGSVTEAKGSWTVPSASCNAGKGPKTTAYSSFWVGVDGFNDNTVEQIGTDSDCQNGRPTYYAWFEFYPNGSYLINGLKITPGDQMSADVVYDPGTGYFTVSLQDVTTPTQQTFSISTTVPAAQRSSAEWIAEAPSSSRGTLPLANFGTVDYGQDYNYNTSVSGTSDTTLNGTAGSIGSFGSPTDPNSPVQEIWMVNERDTAYKATPSPLSGDGSSFSVKWDSAGP